MAFVARWSFVAKFGHKDAAVALCRKWYAEIGQHAGFGKQTARTGSIGASESQIEADCEFDTLADLEKAFQNIAKVPAHVQWGKDMEPHMVSGSNKWEIFRKIDL